MHVVYIHQYFTTRGGAAGTRSYEFARALIARGHSVTMICGSADRAASGLQGAFTEGRRCGTVDGIGVVEFDIGYANQDSLFSRAAKFLKFSYNCAREVILQEYDLIFASSTPLTVVVPGVLAKVIRGKPFVLEVRDLWPELPKAMGMNNPVALGVMRILEYLGYRTANFIIALAPGVAEGIMKRGVSRSRIAIVPNGSDIEFFDSITPVEPSDVCPKLIARGDFVAIFGGAHGRANGLEILISVAKILEAAGRKDIKLLLVGGGATKASLVERAATYSLTNIAFVESMPKPKFAGLLKGADIGLQILANVPAFYQGTSPNKFFDYLAAGRPVLINYPGWLADLVTEESCGIVVPPDDPEAFAISLIALADNRERIPIMGQRARALARRQFDRNLLAARFIGVLEQAATT